MIIHIYQTSQSYLVPEKKMIIFLKHAGATKADIDMNIQWPLCGAQFAALLWHSHSQWQPRETAVGRLIVTRHQLSSALGFPKLRDEKWMALTH